MILQPLLHCCCSGLFSVLSAQSALLTRKNKSHKQRPIYQDSDDTNYRPSAGPLVPVLVPLVLPCCPGGTCLLETLVTSTASCLEQLLLEIVLLPPIGNCAFAASSCNYNTSFFRHSCVQCSQNGMKTVQAVVKGAAKLMVFCSRKPTRGGPGQ